jgi:hypothetical protein
MIPHSTNDRHHFSDNVSYRVRFVLSGRSVQRVAAFKPIRTGNLHLPPVVRLRADDQDPPISSAIRKRMFNQRCHLRTHFRCAARVNHLHDHCHMAAKVALRAANPQTVTFPAWMRRTDASRREWHARYLEGVQGST